jgi:hypothetical protein
MCFWSMKVVVHVTIAWGLCLYCQGSIDSNIFCLSYLATESIVLVYGSVGSKTISEMQADLKDIFQFDGIVELDSIEVEDAYA